MKKLLTIILLATTMVCFGQDGKLQLSKIPQSVYFDHLRPFNFQDTNSIIASSGLGNIKFSKEKITIVLDNFKINDTIWIHLGKQKVGIPAYRFLRYFKNKKCLHESMIPNFQSMVSKTDTNTKNK